MSLILSGSDGLSDVDGSASTPAIRGTDANTGIYFPGADRIGFAEGGTQVGEFDASGNFLFNSGYGSTAVAYGCRAWVNFNGSTATIRASGNVTSVTRSAAGAYVVNFTNALSDTNYSVTADCSGTSFVRLNTLNTGNIDITTLSTNTVTGQDTTTVCLAIFR